MAYRVALVGIHQETNTFIKEPTTTGHFKRCQWLKGEAILIEYQSAYHEIGGMIEAFYNTEFELLPVLYAKAPPGGIIDRYTYEDLVSELFTDLKEVLPIDGCLVALHGAAVSALYPDMDGQWLSALRKILGPDIPIVGTLSPEANVSELMVKATDALIAYKKTSVTDQREAGKEAAVLLIRTLKRAIKPFQYLQPLPLAVSVELLDASREPVRSLYKYANFIREIEGILSTSIFTGFLYADVAEMGASFLIVSNGVYHEAADAMDGMLALLELMKKRFAVPKLTIKSQLPLIASYKKPVLLLDMGDDVRRGSSGASTFLLKAIESYGTYTCFICVCDPEAVDMAANYEKGDTFYLSFGRRYESDREKFLTHVWLLDIIEGVFSETDQNGKVMKYDMGKTAIVLTQQGNTVMLSSAPVAGFGLSQLTTFGIVPDDFDIIIAKGVDAQIPAYSAVCATIIQVDTPGVTRADITKLIYKNRRKPMFPFE